VPPPPPLDPEIRRRLDIYAELLARWTRRINLISASDRAHIWPRHIADSLQLVPLIQANPARAIDIGSGAGLPGLVLAIATGIHFTLIESDLRKCAFLREAARATAAPVSILPARIESVVIDPAPLLTARALAPLPKLLALAAPLLAVGGQMLLPKGAGAAAELTAAQTGWQMRLVRHPSSTDPSATILDITGLQRVRQPD
jgi:16S rRNA (guanine527-N7)-methyltransferase